MPTEPQDEANSAAAGDTLELELANVTDDYAQEFVDGLNRNGVPARKRLILHLDANAEAAVAVTADILTWMNLFKAVALTYGTTLAAHAAKTHWENRADYAAAAREQLQMAHGKLTALVTMLGKFDKRRDRVRVVNFRIDGVTFDIDTSDEGVAVEKLCELTPILESACKAVKTIRDRYVNTPAMGAAELKQVEGGYELRWFSTETRQYKTRRFNTEGEPLGKV